MRIKLTSMMIAMVLVLGAAPVLARVPNTARVSVSSGEVEGDGPSYSPGPDARNAVSAHGRFIAFYSDATNLVADDSNGVADVFVRDRVTGKTQRVSVSSTGSQGNGGSYGAAMSAHGRFIAFYSDATNLVADDSNGVADLFIQDRATGITQRVSLSSTEAQANDGSYYPTISAHGRFIAFYSDATNLVADDSNGVADVFVRDRVTGTTRRVSVSSTGAQANSGSFLSAISAHGRFIAFQSGATNLVAGDSNGADDVFVRDRVTGTTRRVSVSSTGAQGNHGSYYPTMSAHGRSISFYSNATNLVAGDSNGANDVFVRDRKTGKTQRVSVSSTGMQGNDHSYSPLISADGRFVAFSSDATNLVADDSNRVADVFVRDRVTGKTERVDLSSTGAQPNSDSFYADISAHGCYVAFQSDATNLVTEDSNGVPDVFVRGSLC